PAARRDLRGPRRLAKRGWRVRVFGTTWGRVGLIVPGVAALLGGLLFCPAARRDLRGPRRLAKRGCRVRFFGTTWGRLALIVPAFAAMIGLLIWRGPEWDLVADA